MARFEIEARSRRVVINDVDFTDCVYDDSIELVNVSPKGLPHELAVRLTLAIDSLHIGGEEAGS